MLRTTASLVLFPCFLLAQGDPTSPLPTTTPLAASSASGGDVLWAAAARYKVAFDDHFTFYPYVPDQAVTRGFAWRTESLRTGDGERVLTNGRRENGERQCRFEHVGVSEVYDLRDAGVEQSFVVAEPPRQRGPIVITGRIATPFVGAPGAAAVGALAFATPEGAAAMLYGAASVRDAAGRTADVTTAFDGERIELAVGAEFVAAAAFPITIDPLTAPVAVNTGQTVTHTAIAAASTTGNHATLVAFVRQFSTTDRDVYAYTVADDGSAAPAPAFFDFATDDMPHVAAAEVGATQTWVLAVETYTGPTHITIYQQSQANPTTLGWSSAVLPGLSNFEPALGGSAVAGTRVLVVCMQAIFGLPSPKAAVFDTATATFSPSVDLRGALHVGDCRQPTVTHTAIGAEPWRVAWSEDSGNGTDFLIRTNVVDQLGAIGTPRTHFTAINAREPRIDGSLGRYVMTWLETPSGTSSTQLRTRRFDYSVAGAVSDIHDHTLATAGAAPFQSMAQGTIAFDFGTTSHWAVTWRTSLFVGTSLSTSVRIARLGYTGGVVDSLPLHTGTADGVALPVVAFDGYPVTGQQEGFVAAYAANNVSGTVNFRRYSYTLPTGSVYGTSCRSNTMGDGHPPYAGSEFYRMFVAGLVPGTPALYLFGAAPANQPLDFIGMNGCTLLVDYFVSLGTIADAAGLAQMTIALPDDPVYLGDFYFQWFWFEPAANPFGFVTGRGAHIQVQ